jgi:hypothetical protein
MERHRDSGRWAPSPSKIGLPAALLVEAPFSYLKAVNEWPQGCGFSRLLPDGFAL